MKTETKQTHTPGPWEVSIESEPNTLREYIKVTGPDFEQSGNLAHCLSLGKGSSYGVMRPSGEVKANARLIAAAPDLLEAFKDLRNWLSDMAHWGGVEPTIRQGFINRLYLADKTIAKAEARASEGE